MVPQVENALVAKNFVFQFINNYFILFCKGRDHN